jgi:hypothetical protein
MLIRLSRIFACCSLLGCTAFSPATAENPTRWQAYSFNGKEFQEGSLPGRIFIAMRDGYLPVVAISGEALREELLPQGAGGLAMICYMQSSGGKLQRQAGFLPFSGAAVVIVGSGLTVDGQTDSAGYLVKALPPGEYEVRVSGFVRKVQIEKGKSSLIAVRIGKRMVD